MGTVRHILNLLLSIHECNETGREHNRSKFNINQLPYEHSVYKLRYGGGFHIIIIYYALNTLYMCYAYICKRKFNENLPDSTTCKVNVNVFFKKIKNKLKNHIYTRGKKKEKNIVETNYYAMHTMCTVVIIICIAGKRF